MHTPGPWVAYFTEDIDIVRDGEGPPMERTVATVRECREADDNAHLIAAAPELLEACKELLVYLGDWDDPTHETCVKARAAVAKAEGRTNG